MGKGAIYIVLAVILIAAITLLVMWLSDVAKKHAVKQKLQNLEHARLTEPWSRYLTVNKTGAITIGVRRAATIDETLQVFEGPIVMYELAADHDPIDVQLKVQEARDRAALYNHALRADREASK